MYDSSPGGLQWTQVWARPLANSDVAALMFNRASWGGCVACKESVQGCACQGLQFDQIGSALNDTRWNVRVRPVSCFLRHPYKPCPKRGGYLLCQATTTVSVRFVWCVFLVRSRTDTDTNRSHEGHTLNKCFRCLVGVRNHTTAPDVYANNEFPTDSGGAAARLAPHESLLVRLRIVHGPSVVTDW